MEGPSLYLAEEQLIVFKGKKINVVSGNSKVGIERLLNQEVKDIFSWGKHLVFQFDSFAMRVHFLLFGTFEATIEGVAVTGDYKRAREPRLEMQFENGDIKLFNCSIKLFDEPNLKDFYDFSISIMSPSWDSKKALQQIQKHPNEQITDVLLDQDIFAGVGNMIKNEVLSIVKVNPKIEVHKIPKKKLEEIITVTHDFSWQFYEWRKEFALRKHLKIHRKKYCPHCGTQVIREKTGKRERWSYYCPVCQPLK